MSKLVTIFGGSGFVGRYVARRLAKEGWRIRIAVRRPNEALFLKPYGSVGQVEPVFCNIRDDESVRRVMAEADAVVNCVGILSPRGANTHQAVQAEGAGRVARIAAEMGVARLVHISAIGADANAGSLYARTKAEGEAAVEAAFPGAVILRPSIIFGPEDDFFNRFAAMARNWPILPVVHGATRFQPVYVDDVARAVVAGLRGAAPGIYELGGPDAGRFHALMEQMLTIIMRKRRIWDVPVGLMQVTAGLLDGVERLTGGLIPNAAVSRDQLKMLAHDNVVMPGARGFAELGITPLAFEAVLPEYLWRFRPAGQYAAIKGSAKNLRKV
ncbi:complex I NDUFA9 subunit family protein [Falsirhodobacter algicola]|uniref:NAD-dependent epimerase/dehydratase family protein n=1 Tax=Falsirhodobacter algicola TaxID=2692330 RepID=A0A8J8MTE2_9RHOB|nr:complex I NDUFA9 subunit family protein [Falsirhodobacter algicola]QUS36127.1 NAD-dependent epimerase/dehydratase family protein [Falsirhodobacter algicola]